MKYFLLNIFLAVSWAILEGAINAPNLVVGFILGYLVILISRRVLRPYRYLRLIRRVLSLVMFFLWSLIVSNLLLAYSVLAPHLNLMRPRIVAVPLDVKGDVPITVLANLISLTPGSLSLDISSDHRVLYVHVIYAEDEKATVRNIKEGLERRLRSFLLPSQEEA